MQINLPDQTIRDVQELLTRQGSALDVAAFVDRTLQRALFFEAAREIKQRNQGVDPQELQAEIDAAVEAVRAAARKAAPGASRS